MVDLYNKIKNLDYFVDNEYLKKYCQLIERNTRTQQRSNMVHKHHIIPRSWFKLTGKEINNELNNLVNLSYREHFLAHYYLCLCTEDPFKYANQLALMCLQSLKTKNVVDKQLLHRLPLYNNIYEDYMNKLKNNYKLYEGGMSDDNKGNC